MTATTPKPTRWCFIEPGDTVEYFDKTFTVLDSKYDGAWRHIKASDGREFSVRGSWKVTRISKGS